MTKVVLGLALIGAGALVFAACAGAGSNKPGIHLDGGVDGKMQTTHDMAGNGCQSPLFKCNGQCVDVLSDNNNCGTCGVICQNGETCQSGQCMGGGCMNGQQMCNGFCTDTNSDPANCGQCGLACQNGQTCQGGQCTGGMT